MTTDNRMNEPVEMATLAPVKNVDTSPERGKESVDSLHEARVEAAAQFYRWLAEVERAAAAQALTEAANELALLDDGGKRGLAGHSKSSASAITHRHAVAVIRARAAEIREGGKS